MKRFHLIEENFSIVELGHDDYVELTIRLYNKKMAKGVMKQILADQKKIEFIVGEEK